MYITQQSETPVFSAPTVTEYNVSVDLQPVSSNQKYLKKIWEVTADGEEIATTHYKFNEDPSAIGVQCEFTLANFRQRNLITPDKLYNFRIGEMKPGFSKYLRDDFKGNTISNLWIPGTQENVTQSGGQLILDNGGTTDSCFIETEGGSGNEYFEFENSRITFDIDSLCTGTGVVNEFALVGAGGSDIWIDIADGIWTIDGFFSDSGVWDNDYSKLKFYHDNGKIGVKAYDGEEWITLAEFDEDTFFDDDPLFSVYIGVFPDAAPAVGTLTLNRIYSTLFNTNAVNWQLVYNGQRLSDVKDNGTGKPLIFSTVSGLAEKLNQSPPTDVMFYDPLKSPFDASQVEVLSDTEGNTYPVEDFPMSGMSVHGLANEIFVNRLGFSSIVIEFDDWNLKQRSFPMGPSWWESFKGLFPSQARPQVEEIGDVLYIRDSTLAVSADYPAPPVLTVFGVIDYNVNAQYSTADHVLLTYDSSNQESHSQETDFRIEPEQYIEESTGDLMTLERWILILRNINALTNTVVEEFEHDFERRHKRNNTLTKDERISLSWDQYSRISETGTETDELVPDLNNPGEFIFKTNVSRERAEVGYQQHPFEFDKQYLATNKRYRSGLAVVDTDDPNEWGKNPDEFVFAYEDAARVGGVRSGMTYRENQSLKTFSEKFSPKRDGTVYHQRTAYDNLADKPIPTWDEPKVGNVALGGNEGKTRTTMVLPVGGTKGNGTRLDFNAEEMPLEAAIPLARRVLEQVTRYPGVFDGSLVFVNHHLHRNYIFEAKDIYGNSHGYFKVEGFSGDGGVDQDAKPDHTMQLQARQVAVINDSEIRAYQITLASTQSKIITRSIVCKDGYELSSETVSDLTVEARHGSSGGWTNIETGSLDLSTWAGSTENFEIRLTAGTVTSRILKNFKLIVQPS